MKTSGRSQNVTVYNKFLWSYMMNFNHSLTEDEDFKL